MNDAIEKKINDWEISYGPEVRDLNDQIIYLEKKLFGEYEPLLGSHPGFFKRLNDWLDNADCDKDKYTLFSSIPQIFYVGREELNTLYIEAYQSIVKRWIIDKAQISIEDADLNPKIDAAISQTWFCPLTDSLRINQFYHINNIPSKCADYRPDWRSLVEFGDVHRVAEYIEKHEVERIVLIEDFVGNGGQIAKAVEFSTKHFPHIPKLIIPLILCPDGVKLSKDFQDKHSDVQIAPVLCPPSAVFLSDDSTSPELRDLLELIKKYHLQLLAGKVDDIKVTPYSYLGYKKTGGLIVLYTNTPNNTIPIIHYQSSGWNPIFLRHERI